MKLALAQMKVLSGQPKKNLETMLEMIEEAKSQHVDLVAFPEMCVGGYLLGDKWLEDSYCAYLMEFNEEIKKASRGIAITYGNIFLDDHINERVGDKNFHPNKDGRTRKYNAVYIFQNGEPSPRKRETKILPPGVHPKTLLPNYRFFDDERYFFSLKDVGKDFACSLEDLVQPFLVKIGGRQIPVGFEVCEDLWCEDYRRNGNAENVTKILIENGAELIISISASPWTYGKNKARDRRIQFLKQQSGDHFVPFCYVNCTGVQNNGKNIITFDGGSTIYNSKGLPILLSCSRYHQELLVINDRGFSQQPRERTEETKIAEKYDALIQGIQHLKEMMGVVEQPPYVIGLSGGLDSSVVAALLVQAVGREQVIGVNMPTTFNSDKTKQTAALVAKKLGIRYLRIPIGELASINEKLLEQAIGQKLSSLQMGNVAAKIRGTAVLSNLAAQLGGVFTNNGNKLEIALGYATLYGDIGGALAPLGDLTKVEVFELARYLNQEVFHAEVIPKILLPDNLYTFRRDQISPSAELEKNQIDPMKWGYHDAVLEAMTDYHKKTPEDIMRWYLAGTIEQHLGVSTKLLHRWHLDDPATFVDDLEWFTRQIQKNVFKRVQSPPIIVTSKTAYGYDLRESLIAFETTAECERLKEKILQMQQYGSLLA